MYKQWNKLFSYILMIIYKHTYKKFRHENKLYLIKNRIYHGMYFYISLSQNVSIITVFLIHFNFILIIL